MNYELCSNQDPGPELSDVFHDLRPGRYTVHPDREEAGCRLKKSALRVQRSDTEAATVQ